MNHFPSGSQRSRSCRRKEISSQVYHRDSKSFLKLSKRFSPTPFILLSSSHDLNGLGLKCKIPQKDIH